MRVIILPLSHIYVDFHLIFGVFILENVVIQTDGVGGHLNIFVVYYMYTLGRVNSVGIATCYGLNGPGNESRLGARFSSPVQTGPGVHPSSYPLGTEPFPGVERPGCSVDHQPHLEPRLKKE